MTDMYAASASVRTSPPFIRGCAVALLIGAVAGAPAASRAATPAGQVAAVVPAATDPQPDPGATSTGSDTPAESEAPESASGAAQPPARSARTGGHHQSARNSIEMTVSRMARELDLTADQQARLTRVLVAERVQLREAATGGPPNADRVGRAKDILDRTRQKIRDILTIEQRKKYPGVTPSDLLGPAHADVEGWIRATQGKSPPPTGSKSQ